MCTHNGARWVERQVRSMLEQTVVPDQIVLSDDASTDDTVALVEALIAERHDAGSGIELLVLRNDSPLGVTANFEQAVRHCNGSVVILSDQDDEWEAHRVEAAMELFAADEELDLVASDALLIDGELPLDAASLVVTVLSVAVLALGIVVFRRASPNFGDEL